MALFVVDHFRHNIEEYISELEREINSMDLNDPSRQRMEKFLREKQCLGELSFDDIEKVCELGAGNGGVVWKVVHRSSNVVMAQKVNYTPPTSIFIFQKYNCTTTIIYLF